MDGRIFYGRLGLREGDATNNHLKVQVSDP